MEEIKISALARDKADEVHAAFARMDKPGANLGKLEDMVCSLAAMNGTEVPQSLKSAMLLMCGDHGIAKYGVSAYPQCGQSVFVGSGRRSYSGNERL